MKLSLTKWHHHPSPSLVDLLEKELAGLATSLQIDEAKVLFERRLESNPLSACPAIRFSSLRALARRGFHPMEGRTDEESSRPQSGRGRRYHQSEGRK